MAASGTSGSRGGAGSRDDSPGPGDGELEQLRRRLARAVERACPRWLSDQAEDMVQVVLVRLAEARKKSECHREFSSMYLSRVARGVVVDEIRRRYRRREVQPGEADTMERMRAHNPDPERESVSRDMGRGIRDCLCRLRNARRLAVTLYLRGCPAGETAQRLGWTTRKVENLVFRGLRDLRQCLAGKGLTP